MLVWMIGSDDMGIGTLTFYRIDNTWITKLVKVTGSGFCENKSCCEKLDAVKMTDIKLKTYKWAYWLSFSSTLK